MLVTFSIGLWLLPMAAPAHTLWELAALITANRLSSIFGHSYGRSSTTSLSRGANSASETNALGKMLAKLRSWPGVSAYHGEEADA